METEESLEHLSFLIILLNICFIFQDIIRNLDGLSVIGGMLSDCVPKVKEKALNAFNNLSMNIKNQEEIQVSFLKGKIKVIGTRETVQGFQHIH